MYACYQYLHIWKYVCVCVCVCVWSNTVTVSRRRPLKVGSPFPFWIRSVRRKITQQLPVILPDLPKPFQYEDIHTGCDTGDTGIPGCFYSFPRLSTCLVLHCPITRRSPRLVLLHNERNPATLDLVQSLLQRSHSICFGWMTKHMNEVI